MVLHPACPGRFDFTEELVSRSRNLLIRLRWAVWGPPSCCGMTHINLYGIPFFAVSEPGNAARVQTGVGLREALAAAPVAHHIGLGNLAA